jgi:crossover junction endodeoxyribonuclease RusA
MLPFEFTTKGPPVSLQTRRRQRLQEWKQRVRDAALLCVPAGEAPVTDHVNVTITYYYEGGSPDVDNIIKPIQDALNGVVFVDDSQVVSTESRKKSLDGSYRLKGESRILLSAFADGVDFLHVRVSEPPAGQDQML